MDYLPQASILLVANDEPTVNTLKEMVHSLGFTISTASSPHEARTVAGTHTFSLILLDLSLPAREVWTLVDSLRESTAATQTPILILWSDADFETWEEGHLASLVDFLRKPVKPSMLQSKVNMLCQLHRQRMVLDHINLQFQRELQLATRIQRGLLSSGLPQDDLLIYGDHYATCAALGGDIYDVFRLGRGRLGVYLADAAGHGIGAALLSGLVKMGFEALKEHIDDTRMPVSELLDPSIMLTMTNAALHKILPADVFITLQYAVVDPRTRTIRIGNAGHPYPLMVKADGDVIQLKLPSGPALGPMRDASFPVTTFEYGAGDMVIFFSDGLLEMFDPHGEQFGTERLLNFVKSKAGLNAKDMVDALVAETDRHRAGAPLSDDCSIFAIQVKALSDRGV